MKLKKKSMKKNIKKQSTNKSSEAVKIHEKDHANKIQAKQKNKINFNFNFKKIQTQKYKIKKDKKKMTLKDIGGNLIQYKIVKNLINPCFD